MFFFFNDTATTEIYTLSLHDALPIWSWRLCLDVRAKEGEAALRIRLWWWLRATARLRCRGRLEGHRLGCRRRRSEDRKSTRLNSSHANISYAVFCLKKKKTSRVRVNH